MQPWADLGRRGAKSHALKMPKSLFFALHMQRIIKICAVKLIKFILNICILGGFMPQKAYASGAAHRRLAATQEVHLRSRLSASIFGAWG